MRINLLLSTFLFFILVSFQKSFAQTATDTIRISTVEVPDTISKLEMLAMYDQGEVRLRWAPNQPNDWYDLIFSGYRIEKYKMDSETHTPIITSKDTFSVMPWKARDFKSMLDSDRKEDEPTLMAAQCMYGEWESMQTGQLNFAGRADELNNRYGIAMFAADISWEAALSLGLAWKDTAVEEESMYFYRIIPKDTSLNVHNAYTSIQTFDGQIPPPVISFVQEKESVVILQWTRSDHEEYYSAYHIERSSDGSNFKRLLDIPFVGGVSEDFPSNLFSYADTVENYIPYQYRIIGITPFATLSPPSVIKMGMGLDKTPADKPENIDVTCDATTAQITITWNAVSGNDFAGFKIFKASKIDGYYGDVTNADLAPEPTKYKADVKDQWQREYYRIASIDTAGNMNYSLPFLAAFRDTVPPDQPVGLKGTIDSLGIVTLTWDKGKEQDLRGYYVYSANQDNHFFTNKSQRPFTDTVWHDTITLKTFTEKIYYKISAVDFHSHFSDFSETVELSKPDTLRPFPPHIIAYRVEKDHILLETTSSKSKDVVKHILYKRNPGKEWKEVEKFDISNNKFEYFEIDLGAYYEYKLIAVDDADLISLKPDVIRIKAVDLSLPEPPIIEVCGLNQDQSEININWTEIEADNVTYILFKSVNDSPL